MNESLADLKTAGDFETNREYFPFLNSLEENAVRGSLCVPVFGSMTSNTEFEFLTGDSMALVPSNCIAIPVLHPSGRLSGLTSTLKDRATVGGGSPLPKGKLEPGRELPQHGI